MTAQLIYYSFLKKIVQSKKKYYQKQSQKLHAAKGYDTSFRGPKVHHIGSLTEKRREMAPQLGNTEIFSKLYTDVRAKELTNHITTVNT